MVERHLFENVLMPPVYVYFFVYFSTCSKSSKESLDESALRTRIDDTGELTVTILFETSGGTDEILFKQLCKLLFEQELH
jgi:hypothetical protein